MEALTSRVEQHMSTTTTGDTITMFCDACNDDRPFHRAILHRTIEVRGEEIAVAEPFGSARSVALPNPT